MALQIKKTFGYKNRCEIKRQEFLKDLEKRSDKQIIYIDECGLRKNEVYQYGWAPKNSRLYDLKEGSNYKSLNIIGALRNDELIAPFAFEGSCDSNVFNVYVKEVLKPFLDEKTVIILDNASFHRSSKIIEIAHESKAEVLYLPPYSPDFNPIEHQWHRVKTKVRKLLRDGVNNIEMAVNEVFKRENNIN